MCRWARVWSSYIYVYISIGECERDETRSQWSAQSDEAEKKYIVSSNVDHSSIERWSGSGVASRVFEFAAMECAMENSLGILNVRRIRSVSLRDAFMWTSFMWSKWSWHDGMLYLGLHWMVLIQTQLCAPRGLSCWSVCVRGGFDNLPYSDQTHWSNGVKIMQIKCVKISMTM